jgi:hypothetical protein
MRGGRQESSWRPGLALRSFGFYRQSPAPSGTPDRFFQSLGRRAILERRPEPRWRPALGLYLWSHALALCPISKTHGEAGQRPHLQSAWTERVFGRSGPGSSRGSAPLPHPLALASWEEWMGGPRRRRASGSCPGRPAEGCQWFQARAGEVGRGAAEAHFPALSQVFSLGSQCCPPVTRRTPNISVSFSEFGVSFFFFFLISCWRPQFDR